MAHVNKCIHKKGSSAVSALPSFVPTFKILHQGSITVDEEGSEAAVITSVGFTPLSTQEKFLADRPFLFAIYDHPTMSLLFLGRVTNPLKP